MRPSFISNLFQSRVLWIVLASGMVAGAITAKSHATPPAVSLSTATLAAVIPATSETSSPTNSTVTVRADNGDTTPPEDALILRKDTPMPASMEDLGEAVPGPSLSWPAILVLALIVGVGAYLMVSRSKFGPKHDGGRSLEVLDTLRLGGRWQVSLVSAPGRLLVLGASSQAVTLLAELPLEDGEEMPQVAPAVTPPIERPAVSDEVSDDPFLEDLLARMGNSPSTVVRTSSPTDERALLRRRLQSMQRGPSQL